MFASSSFSWYHSNVGAGSAVNWQWNTASPFLTTTWSSGVTTGRGKLLSVREVEHLYDYRQRTIKFHLRGRSCITPNYSGFIKSCQQQQEAGEPAVFRWQCVNTTGAPRTDLMRSENRTSSFPAFSLSFFFFALTDRRITHKR